MAGAIVNSLDLIKRMVDLSRDVAAQKSNQIINDIHVQNCKRLIEDVDLELKSHGVWLSKLAHIQAPKKDHANIAHMQCNNLVIDLKLNLKLVEANKQHTSTKPFPTTLKKVLVELNCQFEELSTKLERLADSINELYLIQNKDDADIFSKVDSFVFTNMVQPNPLHVILDFQNKETPESQLKNAIFQGPDKAVIAVASGMGGIGKTCALRGVGLLEEAKNRFPGGILYMSLGAESGKHELIRNLAQFVKHSGGARASVEIRREDNIAKAVVLTAKWFGDHVCLFLVDDVWCRKGIDSTVVEVLAGLSSNGQSRVAFTTRDRTVRGNRKIQFKKRDDAGAKKILLQSSGCVNISECTSEQSAFQYLLNISDGLPIALGVIGRRARYLIHERSVNEHEVWELVRKDYPQSDDLLLEDAPRDMKNENVSKVLRQSLKMIDCDVNGENMTDLFACLSILQKQQEVPVDILPRIWGCELRRAKTQIERLERFSIVEILHSYQNEKRMCFAVHDLFLDISRKLADEKEEGFRAGVSDRVLNSYVPSKMSPSQNQDLSSQQAESSNKRKSGRMRSNVNRIFNRKQKEQASSSAEHAVASSKATGEMDETIFQEAWVRVSDDGFARRNVFRLLDIAGMYDEGIALILDPRWVMDQVNLFGRKQFNDDSAFILKYIEQNEQHEVDDCTSCSTAIRMVKAALTESEPFVISSSSDVALWSQLYGRLRNLQNYKFIQSFITAIEKFAPTPWVRSQGVLPMPNPLAKKLMNIPNVVLLRSTSDCVDIVHYNPKQRCFYLRHYFPDQDNQNLGKTWKIPYDRFKDVALSADASTLAVISGNEILLFVEGNSRSAACAHDVYMRFQHKQVLQSVSISADGKSLISGGCWGETVMWRLTGSVWKATQLEGHFDDVMSVKMSSDGNKAVSGTRDKTVRIWTQVESGVWSSEVLEGHSCMVTCVDMSRDGRCVVAGGTCKVCVWVKRDSEWVMSTLEGHVGPILNVAVDVEGMRVVSASSDRTALLFDCCEGVWSCKAKLEGHIRHVTFATIDVNHGKIFTSSRDNTVRMWDDTEDHWEPDRVCGHVDMVYDVAVSVDRHRVVSGSVDQEVLLWEKDGSDWKVNSLKKYSGGMVNSVSISSSGRLIVSGSRDGTACVSEEENGRWTSQELVGHTDWVRHVAISLDEEVVVTASNDRTAKIWRKIGRSWELSETLKCHINSVSQVALSKDGSRVVSGSFDRTVRVWDVCRGSRTAVKALSTHYTEVYAVAITPDGRTIASGDRTGTVQVWVQSAARNWARPGQWISKIIGSFDYTVNKLTFSVDGSFLRAEDKGVNLFWYAKRKDAWVNDSARGGASPTEGGVFGDGRLDRRDWPCTMEPVLELNGCLWCLVDGWYFAQPAKGSIAGVLQVIGMKNDSISGRFVDKFIK